MKKIAWLLLCSVTLASCTTENPKNKITVSSSINEQSTQKISPFEEDLYNELSLLKEENQKLKSELINATETTANIDNSNTVTEEETPYEVAKYMKEEYFSSYSEIKENLEARFPDKDVLFTVAEKKDLFPEQMIGESFPCKATETAYFSENIDARSFGDSGDALSFADVDAKLTQGTDELSVKVNSNDTITFLTTAAVKSGSTTGEDWEILRNDERTLIAQDNWSAGIQTLTISKSTGLGIWQKNTASGMPMTYSLPTGLMVYLQCYVPSDYL